MDEIGILLAVLVVISLLGGYLLGIIGFVLALKANRQTQALARGMETLRAKLEELAGRLAHALQGEHQM